jgi:hypothetical protein
MTTASKIQSSTPILAYLIRGLWRRVDWERIPAGRRRNIGRELTDALVPLSVSERSTLGFVRALCTRFEIDVTGYGAACAKIPRSFVPDGIATVDHQDATDTHAIVRWDVACTAIDFGALRIALNENPALFATFATEPEAEGEEAIFAIEARGSTGPTWTATLPGQMVTPRAFRTVWTLVSPLAHGHDEKHGNVILFRRERAVSPVTGEQYLAPFMAGNAVRGMMRDQIVGRMLKLLGMTAAELPPQRAHALLAGGSLEAGADSGNVNVAARRTARAACPAWDLFAGCIDQQIMRGLLRMHDATLVCRENAWKLHAQLAPMVDGRALTVEEFAAALPIADDLTQLRLATRHAHKDLEGSDGSQMIFNTEVILAGAQWAHSFQIIGLDGVSELALSCMADLLAEFQADAFVGAGNARGFGRIAFDAYAPGAGETPLPDPTIYQRWVADHADEMRAWLMSGPGTSGESTTTMHGVKAIVTKPGKGAAKARGRVTTDPVTGEVTDHAPTEAAHGAGAL